MVNCAFLPYIQRYRKGKAPLLSTLIFLVSIMPSEGRYSNKCCLILFTGSLSIARISVPGDILSNLPHRTYALLLIKFILSGNILSLSFQAFINRAGTVEPV